MPNSKFMPGRRRKTKRPMRRSRKRKSGTHSKAYRRSGVKLGKPKVKRSSGRFKKRVSAIHLADTRRFGPTRMSQESIGALVNALNPCSACFADSIGTARALQQQQGWISMFAHTAGQLNAYHSWNPTFTTTAIPSFATMQLQTLLEANKHTLYLQNFSLNHPVCIEAYLCKPRSYISALEMPTSSVQIQAGAITGPRGADISRDHFNWMNLAYSQNSVANPVGFNPNTMEVPVGETIDKTATKYPGAPTGWNAAALTADAMLVPGISPFDNKHWCQKFKVLRTAKTTLGPGKRCRFTLTMQPRMLSYATMGWTVIPGATYVSPYTLFPHSRFWLIAFHACPTPWVADPLSNAAVGGKKQMTALDCPPAVLGMYHVEQFCIRMTPSHSLYPVNQRISAKQTLTTGDVALAFGHIPKIGETAIQGVGGMVATAPSTAAGSYSSITTLF